MGDVSQMMECDPPAWSMAAKEMDAMSKAIDAYEAEHYPMGTLSQQ
jgi:hypothetical protein